MKTDECNETVVDDAFDRAERRLGRNARYAVVRLGGSRYARARAAARSKANAAARAAGAGAGAAAAGAVRHSK